ncbi:MULTISPECIES: LppY/LpqO family protein [unclassified Streptomyces]|uniref:LppY/LpqO family protein n=1 Tax=unclassified Streptomyces TaxID=2593676 RepID=UPI002254EC41|nr:MULTISPECIES: LppY/LpqO family protein [unclassified Streptomyces]MCX4407690.1 DUF1259 domain-containing protein [Streptomyces sp. NBC_01764]MCX5187591.1 DUF1259 domain-containing protein [Streptomyces sp. NBC_00268]
MADERQQDTRSRPIASQRRMPAAAALAPVLTGVPAGARALSPGPEDRSPVEPVMTEPADWADVGEALGRPGGMRRFMYHTGLPRRDLMVFSRGIRINPALALGTQVSFVRYADHSTLLMGDAVVTERELQHFSDVLQEHGITQVGTHKHLLAHEPDVWWVHLRAHSHDPVTVARGLRAAFDRTGTPPAEPTTSSPPVDLDTAAIDAVMGVKGATDGEIYRCTYVRRETVVDGPVILPPGLGATSSVNFQPLGGGRAALSGGLVVIAEEVRAVLMALRRGGVELVEVHHHNLTDEPRLFFVHYWADGDAVRLAQAIRRAVDTTNVVPMPGGAG